MLDVKVGILKVYSFIVLGIIPGTNIQIGFWTWMVLMLLLVIAFRIYKPRFVKLVSIWWHRYDDVMDTDRRPLHASSLHRRLPRPAR